MIKEQEDKFKASLDHSLSFVGEDELLEKYKIKINYPRVHAGRRIKKGSHRRSKKGRRKYSILYYAWAIKVLGGTVI